MPFKVTPETTVKKVISKVRNVSPLFWSFIFLLVTICLWSNGGSLSVTSESLSKITIATLITSEVSIGFLVAWILIQFVEKPAEERAQDENAKRQIQLSQNIFQYLYGVELPDELFKMVEKKILKTPFYRKNYRVDYHFQRHNKDEFLIRVELQCDIHNITDHPQTYNAMGLIEKSLGLGDKVTQPLGLTELFVNNIACEEDKIALARKNLEDTESDYKFEHPIDIPPKGSVNLKVELWMVKSDKDYEMFRVLESTESVKMKVHFPEKIKVDVSAVHPNKDFSHQHMNNNTLTVEMDYPLTPHNGILFWWGPDNAKE